MCLVIHENVKSDLRSQFIYLLKINNFIVLNLLCLPFWRDFHYFGSCNKQRCRIIKSHYLNVTRTLFSGQGT